MAGGRRSGEEWRDEQVGQGANTDVAGGGAGGQERQACAKMAAAAGGKDG